MIKIIVKRKPKIYESKMLDSPKDGDTTPVWVIEIKDIEFVIEQYPNGRP